MKPELDGQVRSSRLGPRLVASAVVAVVLAAAIYLLLVHTALGQRFDNAALLGSYQQSASARIGDATRLQKITADSFAAVLILIVGFGVIRRRPRLGGAVALAAALSVVGTDVLRRVVLNRPVLVHSDAISAVNTFPSGHTATAISGALAIVVVSPPAWRGISAVLAGSYAWITAADVQTAGWHRPSDAIGSALLAFAVVVLVTAVVATRRPTGVGRRFGHLPAAVILGAVWLVAAAISALNAARVLRFLADHSATLAPTPTPAILDDAYRFSINLTVVVVVSLLAALLALLGPHDLDQPSPRS